MPEKKTIAKARRAARKGKAPSTQAGEFVREEIHHIREGKHGTRSPPSRRSRSVYRRRAAPGLTCGRPEKARSEKRPVVKPSAPTSEGKKARPRPAVHKPGEALSSANVATLLRGAHYRSRRGRRHAVVRRRSAHRQLGKRAGPGLAAKVRHEGKANSYFGHRCRRNGARNTRENVTNE